MAQSFERRQRFYNDLKARVVEVRALGRISVKIMPGVLTVVGTRRGTRPRRSSSELQALIHPELGVPASCRHRRPCDLSKYPPRWSVCPDVPLIQLAAGPVRRWCMDMAAPENLTDPPALQCGWPMRTWPSRRGRHARATSPMRWRSGIAAARPTASTSCRRPCPVGVERLRRAGDPRSCSGAGCSARATRAHLARELGLPRPANRFAATSAAAEYQVLGSVRRALLPHPRPPSQHRATPAAPHD